LAFFASTDRGDAPLYERRVTAHTSLPVTGFVWLIGTLCGLFLIPLLAFLGSMVLWGILIRSLCAVAGVSYAIYRNNKDRSVSDHIRIWSDQVAIERRNPDASRHHWLANPHWVKLRMADTPTHENYLTLTGGSREIEVGGFLTADQRSDLHYELLRALRNAKGINPTTP